MMLKIILSTFFLVLAGMSVFVVVCQKLHTTKNTAINISKWEKISSRDSVHAVGFSSIFFFDENNGIAQTVFEMKQTTDGGYTWNSKYDFEQKGVYSLRYTKNNDGWIVGSDENNNPFVLTSNNKSSDWQKVAVSEAGKKFTTFYDICFDKSGESWIVGDGGALRATVRWFNKSGEKTVFGRISKRCGKNTMMNLSAMP